MRKASLAVLLLSAAALVLSQSAPRPQVGPLDRGGFLLTTGWVVQPAGTQVPVGTLPMAMALSPDGAWLLVLNGGFQAPTISVIDAAAQRETARVRIPDGWLGLAFSPAGDRVYAGGGADASIIELSFTAGKLAVLRRLPVPAAAKTADDFVGDVAVSPDGGTLYAAVLYRNQVVAMDAASGQVKRRFATGQRPYRIRLRPDGGSLFVSGWGDGTVYHHDAGSGRVLERIKVGPHPTDMVWRYDYLFVALANANTVAMLEPAEGGWRLSEQINVSLTPRQPVGMTPSALAVSPDATTLYVACSDANALAVVDIAGASSQVRGFVPAGWYPTAVLALPDGRIAAANGKGARSFANPDRTYVASLQVGSVSLIGRLDDAALAAHTKAVLANCPYRDAQLDDAGVPAAASTGVNNPVPSRPGDPSPIRNVLYIIRENRTYDQVLGDMREGMGDASLALFGENVTPNAHKLAREFVLFDNFYVNADVSADGHNWSTAAIAPDYVQKLWPTNYAGRGQREEYGPGGTPEEATGAPNGYVFTAAFQAGLSIRSYGYTTDDGAFGAFVSPGFRPWDLDYADADRAKAFVKELGQFEQSGALPRFMIMYLGRDHTYGGTAGRPAPTAMVADNDYALGMVIEALSRSRFWRQTAVFVLEDDAQDGPDHIDSHRSPVLVISPYTRRGVVDSTQYNTASVLRTMELILGLPPLTQFDAAATPMWAAFRSDPDVTPYTAEPPRVNLNAKNPASAPTAQRSAGLDFSRPDAIPDAEMNEILWLELRGVPPPAPRHSRFGGGETRSGTMKAQ